MKNHKKHIFLLGGFVLMCLMLLSFTSALVNYDQRVYKVSSSSTSWNSNLYEKYNNANTPQYSYYGMEDTRRSFFGDYVKEYSAYVTNRGQIGRYYTVIFEFEDNHGFVFSQSVTKYLRKGESKRFVYRDIQYEQNEILDWNYRITYGK